MQQGLTNHKRVIIKTPFHSPFTPLSARGFCPVITLGHGEVNLHNQPHLRIEHEPRSTSFWFIQLLCNYQAAMPRGRQKRVSAGRRHTPSTSSRRSRDRNVSHDAVCVTAVTGEEAESNVNNHDLPETSGAPTHPHWDVSSPPNLVCFVTASDY